jgi:hypothetical protein
MIHSLRSLSAVLLHLLVASVSAGKGGDFISNQDAGETLPSITVVRWRRLPVLPFVVSLIVFAFFDLEYYDF